MRPVIPGVISSAMDDVRQRMAREMRITQSSRRVCEQKRHVRGTLGPLTRAAATFWFLSVLDHGVSTTLHQNGHGR